MLRGYYKAKTASRWSVKRLLRSGSVGDLPPESAGFDSRTSTSLVSRMVSLQGSPERRGTP